VVAEPVLAFGAVVTRLGGRRVLDGVDLLVPARACFALVGANGAGKTTCIRSLLDFCAVEAGSIRLFGQDHRRAVARARLAFLPERFLPPHHLTGFEFLAYHARLHGEPAGRDAARRAAAAVDLDPEALGRPARSYSKGMAQKLGLAACLASHKELLVLDEPMSGLDPGARVRVKRRLAALREAGRTLFFSTHVLADVQALCDAMAILHAGRVRFAGTPSECLAAFGGADLEEAYLHCIEG
jgi:ABC-2 type transport system ATP-binding protein